jgi:hypothetical protein
MTENVAIALIGSISATTIGLFNAYVLLKTHEQSKSNGEGISHVKEQTNGMQAKLMAVEKGISFQEGIDSQKKP